MSAEARPVSVLMVAIGGYGYYYLRALLDEAPADRALLAGVVDPQARQSRAWREVEDLGVPVCRSMEAFYAPGRDADLAVIASPIQWHAPQAVAALAHGSHVLCDKPLGATIQEAAALAAARNASGRSVAIGYQWSFSTAIQGLKRDIVAGLFGRPRRFSALCCWPRDEAYYGRNCWAGRLRDPQSGRWVLDGPANNAMAHSLHNLLYLGGGQTATSARPRHVRAELYRAFDIESCDTVACRIVTEEQLEVLFFASHATKAAVGPCFRLEFEEGSVSFDESERTIVAIDAKGRRKEYGAPDDTPQFKKLHDAIARVRERSNAVCGIEAAEAQTLAVNGLHESVTEVLPFPDALVERDLAAGRRSVRGLDEVLRQCYAAGELPSEAGVEWAVAGAAVCLDGYRWFPARDARVVQGEGR